MKCALLLGVGAVMSELLRAWHGIFAPNTHAIRGANSEREKSTVKGTLAGRASSDAVTFRGGSRTSVVQNNAVVSGSVNLSELVRAPRSVVAPDACAARVANAKR